MLAIPAFAAIRTKDDTYVEYVTGEKELYDLRSDPYELQNIVTMADAQLVQQLAARLAALRQCKAAGCRSAESVPITP